MNVSKKLIGRFLTQLKLGLAIFLVFVVLTSCGTIAPVLERDTAADSIRRAREIDSEKFSPENYVTALNHYKAGEDLINLKEKNSDNGKAKTEYSLADSSARDAYKQAIGPFVQDKIDKNSERLENARLEKADIVSPTEFGEAEKLNNSAKSKLKNVKYTESVQDIYDSFIQLEMAISNTRYYKAKVDEYDQQAKELMQQAGDAKASAATPELYDNAYNGLDIVREQVERGEYAKSIEDYPSLLDDIQSMLDAIEEKRIMALREFEEASEVIENIKKNSEGIETGESGDGYTDGGDE